jgi:signal transduction histidine kinase
MSVKASLSAEPTQPGRGQQHLLHAYDAAHSLPLQSRPAFAPSSSWYASAAAAGRFFTPYLRVFDPREFDAYLLANLLNILASCFYFASTLYGFALRMRIGERMDHMAAASEAVSALAEAAASVVARSAEMAAEAVAAAASAGSLSRAAGGAMQAGGGVLARSTAILFSTRTDYSDPLHPTSSPSPFPAAVAHPPHAHPAAVLSYELEVEGALHVQQVIQLVGDALYFAVAAAMEYAYYKDKWNEEEQRQRQRQQQQQQRRQQRDDGSKGQDSISSTPVVRSTSDRERDEPAGAAESPAISPASLLYLSVLTPATAYHAARRDFDAAVTAGDPASSPEEADPPAAQSSSLWLRHTSHHNHLVRSASSGSSSVEGVSEVALDLAAAHAGHADGASLGSSVAPRHHG